MAQDWNMPRRGDHCRGCQRVFEPGDLYRALLFETEHGYEREELCLECPPRSDDFLASWRTRRPLPTGPQRVRLDLPAVFSFFERLSDATEPEKIQFRFVLALLLWRKKALRLQDTGMTENGEIWLFLRPKSDDRYEVLRPALDDQRIEELSEQLETLLSSGVAEFPEAAAPQAESAAEASGAVEPADAGGDSRGA